MVYVFCGQFGCGRELNSIETISESALVPQSKARWELIQVPENILSPREQPAVAPINDTEIAVLGGYSDHNYFSDVILFNRTSKECEKVAVSDYKFCAPGN